MNPSIPPTLSERAEHLTRAVQADLRSRGMCGTIFEEDGEPVICQARVPCALHGEEP